MWASLPTSDFPFRDSRHRLTAGTIELLYPTLSARELPTLAVDRYPSEALPLPPHGYSPRPAGRETRLAGIPWANFKRFGIGGGGRMNFILGALFLFVVIWIAKELIMPRRKCDYCGERHPGKYLYWKPELGKD